MILCGHPTDFVLPSEEIRKRFDCRESHQRDFLVDFAETYREIGACCFVSAWTDTRRTDLAGYVTFSPCLLTVKQQNALINKNGFIYDIPSHMPCWLIGQLCRHKSKSCAGLGRALLFYAISEIVNRAENGAGGLIVIDVVTRQLVDYYTHCGFKPLYPQPLNWVPRNGALRMYMEMPLAQQIARIFTQEVK